MRLESILQGISVKAMSGQAEQEISGIYYDSRKVSPGALFVCIKGFQTDGHQYIKQAVDKGAVAVLGEDEEYLHEGITYIQTENTRSALSKAAANFYGHPSQRIKVIGVTGTNGKTTTTHLMKAILEEAGHKTAIIGTLYAMIGDIKKELGRTTPEAIEIQEFLNLAEEQGAEYVVMEVSSHALDLKRVNDIEYRAAVFTNLSQDHLDYHNDMEGYKIAKLELFSMIKPVSGNYCIINADDDYAGDFAAAAAVPTIFYGLRENADVIASGLKIGLDGTSFEIKYDNTSFSIDMPLIGMFSVYNALAAVSFALQEGIKPSVIKRALRKMQGVAGRFEAVRCGQDFTVIVDYAHTPDGLENILKTARQITEKRVITVFGCGGDRDRTKRPLMGEIAAKYSDFCVVTSDNPRSEEPQAIIDDIVPGLDKVKDSRYAVILDRREAIRHAIFLARPGDILIIAGKGHETYQLVKDKILDFDDRKVATEFLKGR